MVPFLHIFHSYPYSILHYLFASREELYMYIFSVLLQQNIYLYQYPIPL